MRKSALAARTSRHRTADVTDFNSSPSYLITALGNKISVIAARNIKRLLGLSLMEWRVLAVLAVEPAAPPGRIIDLVGVNKAAVSRAVNALERRRLIRRASAPDHGLRTHLYLTQAGQAVHNRGIGGGLEMEERLLADYSRSDRATLVKLLKKMMRNLGEIGGP